jgi:hypothetical protein
LPFSLQLAAPLSVQTERGSPTPAAVMVHLPCELLQDRQAPLQEDSQHVPSTQKPLSHWLSFEQARPFGS